MHSYDVATGWAKPSSNLDLWLAGLPFTSVITVVVQYSQVLVAGPRALALAHTCRLVQTSTVSQTVQHPEVTKCMKIYVFAA